MFKARRIIVHTSKKTGIILSCIITFSFLLSGCYSNKQRALGDLAKTQYCQRYKEFETRVATASDTKQRELLEKVLEASDFPDSPPSLKKDYRFVIDGYKKVKDGHNISHHEDEYEQASIRINRHAVEHCETLKSESGSGL